MSKSVKMEEDLFIWVNSIYKGIKIRTLQKEITIRVGLNQIFVFEVYRGKSYEIRK